MLSIILSAMLCFFPFLVEQVFVANHTSMIDFIVLEQMTAFAVIMQKHPGWVGECSYYAEYVKMKF